VGSVKLAYAYTAERAGRLVGNGPSVAMDKVAAAVMIEAGLWVIVRT
jgi:hypothetical protein